MLRQTGKRCGTGLQFLRALGVQYRGAWQAKRCRVKLVHFCERKAMKSTSRKRKQAEPERPAAAAAADAEPDADADDCAVCYERKATTTQQECGCTALCAACALRIMTQVRRPHTAIPRHLYRIPERLPPFRFRLAIPLTPFTL